MRRKVWSLQMGWIMSDKLRESEAVVRVARILAKLEVILSERGGEKRGGWVRVERGGGIIRPGLDLREELREVEREVWRGRR